MKKENFEITFAKKREYKKLGEVYSKSFTKEEYNEEWTQKKAIEKIKILKKYCEIFSIKLDKEIIGLIAINPNKFYPGGTIEIKELAICPEFQGKGFGKKSLEFIEETYKKRSFGTLIFISYKESKANPIYKHLGYKKSKKQIFYEKRLK